MRNRQTVRQQTGANAWSADARSADARSDSARSADARSKKLRSNVRSHPPHQSGNAKPLQTRSAHPSRATAHVTAQPSRQPRSASFCRRSNRFWLVFVFGLWAVSLAAAALAARSLLDPAVVSSTPPAPALPAVIPAESPVSLEIETSPAPVGEPSAPLPPSAPSPVPVALNPTAQSGVALDDSYFSQPAETGHLPIIALGSIAVSCAMSCILVLRVLHPRRSPPRLQNRSGKLAEIESNSGKRLPAAPLSQEISAAQGMPAAVSAAIPAKDLAKDPAKASATSESQSADRDIQNSKTQEQRQRTGNQDQKNAEVVTPAVVTVLSSDQSLALDWEEPSLADSLDLRQRQSLPFWS